MNHGWPEIELANPNVNSSVNDGGLSLDAPLEFAPETLTEAPSKFPNELLAESAPEKSPTLLKMRCPNCQKNYSVEESWVYAAPLNSQRAFVTPLRFECFSCKSRFEALRPPGPGATTLETNLIPVSAPSPMQPARGIPRVERAALAKVPLIAQTLKCPKCGVRTNGLATECLSCGVVFSRYKPLPDGAVGEIRLEGRRDILELWETIIGDYEDEIRHERFVEVCADAGALAFAAQKYSRILSVSPQEEIARRMKKRIVALASYPLESRGTNGVHSFRVPKFVDLILFLGAATATAGFTLHGMKAMAGIGVAAIALALGVRFFLRPRQT